MTAIAAGFAEALGTVRRPGAFFVAGSEQTLAPGLAVVGVGPVALPLLPVQAEQLIATAERAPYGRGEDTLTDIGVRRTWQIAPGRVRLESKHWPATVQAIVARVAEGLGVADPVEADLYKLLIYDQGSFFVPHRDTEKVPGMFATLVMALPSVSEGGTLIVRHNDQEVQLPLHCEEPSDVAFAAFYADCVHEVRPVTAGYRLVLVYNLVRCGPGHLPTAPDYGSEEDEVVAVLEQWAATLRSAAPAHRDDAEPDDAEPDDAEPDDAEPDDEPDNDEPDDDEPEGEPDDDQPEGEPDDDELGDDEPEDREPEKLIYPLEHAYTPAELSFGSLKGADAGIAQVVVAAARRAGCDVHLALISIEESGSAEYSGSYRPSGRGHARGDDDDEFEVLEIIEQDAIASNWRRPDGAPSPLTELPVREAEFSPPLSFEDLEPDEQHFHEATGNEGASFERTYRRAALILWPRERLLAVINQGGLKVTLPFLADLTARWEARGDASIRDQASVLAGHMTLSWRMNGWYPRRDSEPTHAGHFLDLLVRLRDTPMAETFLTALVGRHGFDSGDCAAIAATLGMLPPDRASTLTARLIEGATRSALGPCANLLVRLSAIDSALATSAARVLVAALPGGPPVVLPAMTGHRTPAVRPDFIIDLCTALGRIDVTLAAVSADHVLDWPATYDFDTVLVPAMRNLLDVPETAGQRAVQRLRAACASHLDTRIALPLEPPADWRRDHKLGCDCQDCQALAVFLGDAAQKVWVFAAAEPRRRHVEHTIRTARCDVDTATEKRGSPHRLVCTKNQASYQRRCAQRTNDLVERARLNV